MSSAAAAHRGETSAWASSTLARMPSTTSASRPGLARRTAALSARSGSSLWPATPTLDADRAGVLWMRLTWWTPYRTLTTSPMQAIRTSSIQDQSCSTSWDVHRPTWRDPMHATTTRQTNLHRLDGIAAPGQSRRPLPLLRLGHLRSVVGRLAEVGGGRPMGRAGGVGGRGKVAMRRLRLPIRRGRSGARRGRPRRSRGNLWMRGWLRRFVLASSVSLPACPSTACPGRWCHAQLQQLHLVVDRQRQLVRLPPPPLLAHRTLTPPIPNTRWTWTPTTTRPTTSRPVGPQLYRPITGPCPSCRQPREPAMPLAPPLLRKVATKRHPIACSSWLLMTARRRRGVEAAGRGEVR
mmetsp:Transcript_17395/g.49351  ORF Transcript_17395/g.49351 Transcript_17395/m.49351 type:complete len:351 (+) Transcript_17395:243-1295(+)